MQRGMVGMWVVLWVGVHAWVRGGAAAPEPAEPRVEAEETVYAFEPADNGAGPMWCKGSTCLVRVGDVVYASGLETLAGAKPLNNCRWLLFRRDTHGWKRVAEDPAGRTREPSPLAVYEDGRLFLSANPTVVTDPGQSAGPARPEILEFGGKAQGATWTVRWPEWEGAPPFTEHSYRSLAADGEARELILFQNIDYTHAEWAFLGRDGAWQAKGRLKWPWGADYEKPQPIRVCYPNVALQGRAVHFCGVSDIVEPRKAWREFKRELTGREWDYDFRRLFYTWTPDVTKEGFHDWVEVASREATCGWVDPCDLRVRGDGAVELLWTERAIDERLRDKFFPEARQRHQLNWALLREGKVVLRRTLLEGGEGLASDEVPGVARFHVDPEGRVHVLAHVGGARSENRLLTLSDTGEVSRGRRLGFRTPFVNFFVATPRAGCAASWMVDILGVQAGAGQTIRYARVSLK